MLISEQSIAIEQKEKQENPCLKGCNRVNGENDSELWSAFVDGDEQAFMRIYKNHFSALCKFGLRYAPSDMVEDAVQDLFIHLRKNQRNLPRLKNSLRPFLYQCLKRRLFNMLKRNKEIYKAEIPDEKMGLVPCPESNILVHQDQEIKLERLGLVLAGLKKRHRQVIYYYYFQEMSYNEVSDVLGFQDVKSARNMIYKIVKNLRRDFFLKKTHKK